MFERGVLDYRDSSTSKLRFPGLMVSPNILTAALGHIPGVTDRPEAPLILVVVTSYCSFHFHFPRAIRDPHCPRFQRAYPAHQVSLLQQVELLTQGGMREGAKGAGMLYVGKPLQPDGSVSVRSPGSSPLERSASTYPPSSSGCHLHCANGVITLWK